MSKVCSCNSVSQSVFKDVKRVFRSSKNRHFARNLYTKRLRWVKTNRVLKKIPQRSASFKTFTKNIYNHKLRWVYPQCHMCDAKIFDRDEAHVVFDAILCTWCLLCF